MGGEERKKRRAGERGEEGKSTFQIPGSATVNGHS